MGFYSNFLYQCASKGVSPSAAALAVNLSNAAATGWKKGKQPSDVTLAKLAAYFGCTVDDLTADPGQKNEPTPVLEDGLDATTMELIKIANEVSEVDRQLLLDMARSIKKRRES